MQARLDADYCLSQGATIDKSLTAFEVAAVPATSTTTATGTAESAPTSLEAAIIQGIADFVADRGKQEALQYVVDQLGKKLCAKQLRGYEVRSFFPESCALLTGRRGLGDAQLTEIGSTFQSALQSDLWNLVPVILEAASARDGVPEEC